MMDDLNKGDGAVSGSIPRPVQQWSQSTMNFTHLQLAIWNLKENSLFYLLYDFPLHYVDLKGKGGVTALHMAARRGWLHLIQQLVEQHNATLDVQDDDGLTPELYAEMPVSNACYSYLKKKRVESNIPACQVSDQMLEQLREQIFEWKDDRRAFFGGLDNREDERGYSSRHAFPSIGNYVRHAGEGGCDVMQA
jgi:ankyrin repeat protein